MIFFSRNNSRHMKFFVKPVQQQLKLIYTYSHTELFTQSLNRKYLKRLLGSSLHKHWLQNPQSLARASVKSTTNTQFFNNPLSLRSVSLVDGNNLILHRLYSTTISYNSNRSVLWSLMRTSTNLDVVNDSWLNYSKLNTKVLYSFLKQLYHLYNCTNFIHLSFSSTFSYPSPKYLRMFNATTSKLTSSTEPRNTLPLIFSNIRYL
jgi:hypothetical protein